MCVCVCVRRTDEGSRRKCGQYWPKEDGDQEVYGHIAVVNHRVDKHAHYNQTTLELHNTEVPYTSFCLNVFNKQQVSNYDFIYDLYNYFNLTT